MVNMETPKSDLARCGLLRRLAAISYDAVIVTGLLIAAAAVASLFGAGEQQAFRDPVFTFYLLAIWFFYLAAFWMRGGMTVGMRAWKIRILPDEGSLISWKTSLLRFLMAFVSIGTFGIGMLWSLFDKDKRCWHDMFSQSGLYHSP